MADMDEFANKALWAIASGTVGAVILLWREFYAFRLEVAKNYANTDEIKEIVEAAVAPTNAAMIGLRAQVADASESMVLILRALKIEVPAVRKR